MIHLAHQVAERMPKLKQYARSLTPNKTDAEDLVHECVERTLMRLNQFDERTNLDALLMTIMRNVFINGKRH